MLFGINTSLYIFLTCLLGLFLGGIPALYFIAFKKRIILGIISVLICGALGTFVHFAFAVAAAVILFIIAFKIPEHDPSAKAARELMADMEKEENEKNSGTDPSERKWKCPDCGKMNNHYINTCVCGTKKP